MEEVNKRNFFHLHIRTKWIFIKPYLFFRNLEQKLIKKKKKKPTKCNILVLSRSIQPSRGTHFRTFNVDDCNTLHAGLTTNWLPDMLREGLDRDIVSLISKRLCTECERNKWPNRIWSSFFFEISILIYYILSSILLFRNEYSYFRFISFFYIYYYYFHSKSRFDTKNLEFFRSVMIC